MKRIILIGLVIAAAAAALFTVSMLSANEENVIAAAGVVEKEKNKEEKHSCCADEEEAGEFSDNSIYQLESEWIDQDAKKTMLADFKGKPVVMTMFFASCTYACPILVQDMKRIETELPAEKLKDYRFVLLSIDPERDTPEKLKEFSRIWRLDEKRWTLLTGSEDDVMELAALIGFKFKKEKDGQFSHSNIINILDEEGEIVYQHKGLNQDITIAANNLINEQEN